MVKPLLASAAENISMLVVLFSACEQNAKHPFAVMPTRTKKKAFHHAQRLIASHAARGHNKGKKYRSKVPTFTGVEPSVFSLDSTVQL